MSYEEANWLVESDGYGPYVVQNGGGRVATVECESFSRNGGPNDWKIAHLLSSAPNLRKAVGQLLELLNEVKRLNDIELIDSNMQMLKDAEKAIRKADHKVSAKRKKSPKQKETYDE